MPWLNARGAVIAGGTQLQAKTVEIGAVHPQPGGPATALAADPNHPAALAATMQRYGFNQPLPLQYVRWLGEVVGGQLGHPLITDIPGATPLQTGIPITPG